MTSLRKKEPLCPDNLPIEENWHVATGQRDGKPMFVRSHTGYREFKGVTGYEHQIGIAVPLRDPDANGLPKPAENEELNSIEDAICPLLEAANESLFVAAITTGGMREFIFYSKSPDQVKAKFQQLRDEIPDRKIQLKIQPDKEWVVYFLLA
jgi:hypothetical protein